MLSYLVAYGLLLHLLFWGAGLAMLAMPRGFKSFWFLFAPAAGIFLQSLVVWIGAYAGLKGTHVYAWPSEIIALGLLWFGLKEKEVNFLKDIKRFSAVVGVIVVALFFIVRPITQAASGLTTISLGSCDAADYAGGARALMEFARSDRSGFLGLTDVVRVMSVDNFSDYFLKLNHFTPSALIAFNGTIFHCAPYELISLFTAVSLVLVASVVFWCARSLFKLGVLPSLIVTAIYCFSPAVLYAVYHVAIGQLFAALAIAWVTWAGVFLWKYKRLTRNYSRYLPLLVIAYGIILGSYNFIIIVTLASCSGYVLLELFIDGNYKPVFKWLGILGLPCFIAGVIFWDRVVGLIERFILFRTFDEGWKIPAFTPEGWFGIVQGPSLLGYAFNVRLAVSIILISILFVGLVRQFAITKHYVLLSVGFIFPIVIGYVYLIVRGMQLGTNASYDGYKLFSVFYPVILPALVTWIPRRFIRLNLINFASVGILLLILGANILGARGFFNSARNAPLVVGRDLIGLQNLEKHPEITSVNMRIPDMWSRLWANAFLLKVPQYFLTHTYEARLNTPLKGEWDLYGGIFHILLPDKGSVRFNAHYSAVKVSDPYRIGLESAKGWYDIERLSRSTDTWCWASLQSSIVLTNNHTHPLSVRLTIEADSLIDQVIYLSCNGVRVSTFTVTPKRAISKGDEFLLPSGTTEIAFVAQKTPPRASPTDSRELAFRVYDVDIHVLP